jgi:hypothetical protein
MNALMWCCNFSLEVNDAPLRDWPWRMEKSNLDLIEPGRARRREMEVEVWIFFESTIALLMGVEIVEDDVQVAIREGANFRANYGAGSLARLAFLAHVTSQRKTHLCLI